MEEKRKKFMNSALIRRAGNLPVDIRMIDIARELVLTGNIDKVAAKLNVTRSSIIRMLRESPEFNKLLDQFLEVFVKELKIEIVHSAREALNVMLSILRDPVADVKERRIIAQDILDRAGLLNKYQNKTEVNNTVNYFANLPDNELDKIIDLKIDVETGEYTTFDNIKDVEFTDGHEGENSFCENGEAEASSV